MTTKKVIINGREIRVSKVSSIVPVGAKRVYDITVEGSHNYFANGINVHNCSYHTMLTEYEQKYGDGALFKMKDTFVIYRHRSLYVYPAAPDIRSLRGRTRAFGGIDELGWIPTGGDANKNVKLNADGIYKAMERSLLTVRASASKHFRRGQPDVPSGFFINISSPSSPRDKIMSLVNEAQLSEHVYGINKPTWEMNPHIGREDLAPEFEKDHVAAMRDYGAQPPLTGSPYINNPDIIVDCIGKNKNGLKLEHHTVRSSKRDVYEIYSSVERMAYRGKPSILAIDAGVVNNSFAFALGYLSKDSSPVIAMVGEIIPHAGMRINYSMAYRRFLSPIIEGCNVKLLAADRWNSLKILSDAEAEFDIQTRQHSLKYKEIMMLKSYMEEGLITFPKPSTDDIDKILKFEHAKYPLCFRDKPVDHLIVQLLTVQDTGSAVIKGDNLTDDIARAVMLCVSELVDQENASLLAGPEKEATAIVDVNQMIYFKGLSGGGSTATGSNSSATGTAIGFLKT